MLIEVNWDFRGLILDPSTKHSLGLLPDIFWKNETMLPIMAILMFYVFIFRLLPEKRYLVKVCNKYSWLEFAAFKMGALYVNCTSIKKIYAWLWMNEWIKDVDSECIYYFSSKASLMHSPKLCPYLMLNESFHFTI